MANTELTPQEDTPIIDDGYVSTYTGFEIDRAIGTVRKRSSAWDNKQSKILGSQGQIVGFDSRGNAVGQDFDSFALRDVVTAQRHMITLPADGWSNKAQNVYVEGISDDEGAQLINVIPKASDFNTYAEAEITVTQSLNQLLFTCEEPPILDIRLFVVVQNLNISEEQE